jgi:hypothetical protein
MNAEILYSEVKRAFPRLDNKAVHAFCRGLWSMILKWKKNEVVAATAKLRSELVADSGGGDGFKKFLENPMSDEERHKYVKASIDFAISTGADVKELEVLLNKLGLSEEKPEPIQVVNFSDAVEIWEGLR